MVTSDKFRQVMGNFATGITVVTTRGNDGQTYGLTVNAFTSVSLDPLLVLVCLDNRLSSLLHFKDSKKFGISILSEHQEGFSGLFAKKDSIRPSSLYFDGPAGQPLLRDALACLECETYEMYDGGDHQILVGKVNSAECLEGKETVDPILYFRGKYRRLS